MKRLRTLTCAATVAVSLLPASALAADTVKLTIGELIQLQARK